jgi:hypothetical protein
MGVITGYIGIICFVIVLVPIIAAFYFIGGSSTPWTWIQSIVPCMCVGLWYALFTFVIDRNLPKNLGDSNVLPADLKEIVESVERRRVESVEGLEEDAGCPTGFKTVLSIVMRIRKCFQLSLSVFAWAFRRGLMYQISNIGLLSTTKDLGLFLLANAFLSGAAATAFSAATIIASEIFRANLIIIGACAIVGVLAAITGLLVYQRLEAKGILSAKGILIVALLVTIVSLVYVLFITRVAELFIVVTIAGSQIGAFGAFSRSIVASLAPQRRQARMFSLWECIQEASSWVGPFLVATLSKEYGHGSGRVFVNVVVYVSLTGIGVGLPILAAVNVKRGVQCRSIEDQNATNVKRGAECRSIEDPDVLPPTAEH